MLEDRLGHVQPLESQADAPGLSAIGAQGQKELVLARGCLERDLMAEWLDRVDALGVVQLLAAVDPHLGRAVVTQQGGQLHRFGAVQRAGKVDHRVLLAGLDDVLPHERV